MIGNHRRAKELGVDADVARLRGAMAQRLVEAPTPGAVPCAYDVGGEGAGVDAEEIGREQRRREAGDAVGVVLEGFVVLGESSNGVAVGRSAGDGLAAAHRETS